MKILITGAKGQLGQELIIQSQKIDFEIIATHHTELDITKPAQIEHHMVAYQPGLVINTAAYTAVDAAESNPDRAFRVNRDGPANLAAACVELGIPLIQISTDYVFDGRKKKPYIESDRVAPLGVYGQSKAKGEEKIRSLLSAHIILRTSWLYGVFGRNFVKTMLQLGAENKVIKVVNDQFGSPTSAQDLAQTVMALALRIRKNSSMNWGTYHFCGQGVTSWHQFAVKIFDFAHPHHPAERPLVKPVPTDPYRAQAKRPSYSALNCSLIKKKFSIHPKPWQKSLEITINRIIDHDRKKKS